MTLTAARTGDRTWLDAGAVDRLERRLETALHRARSGAPGLVSVTSALDRPADPSAVVAASRRPGEPWFCFEQPDRDGAALAALGSVVALEADGPDRFARLAKRWRAIAGAALADCRRRPGRSRPGGDRGVRV